jgi:FHA domain
LSIQFLLVVSVVALMVMLGVRPKLRRWVRDRVSREMAPVFVRLLGPMSPKAFVAALVRAAKTRSTETHTGAFLPDYVMAGVSPAEYDSWGPLAKDVGDDAECALREVPNVDDDFLLLGRPTVIVKRDPLAKPRRPRFVMSVLGGGQVDATVSRPSRPGSGSEDPTPLMTHRQKTGHILTGPVAELELLVRGRASEAVELGEGRHTIGRHGSCAVVIEDPSVSQRAAVVSVTRSFTSVQDLGSRNGVYLGRVKADVPLVLSDGDVVTLSGSVQLRILRSGARRRAS